MLYDRMTAVGSTHSLVCGLGAKQSDGSWDYAMYLLNNDLMGSFVYIQRFASEDALRETFHKYSEEGGHNLLHTLAPNFTEKIYLQGTPLSLGCFMENVEFDRGGYYREGSVIAYKVDDCVWYRKYATGDHAIFAQGFIVANPNELREQGFVKVYREEKFGGFCYEVELVVSFSFIPDTFRFRFEKPDMCFTTFYSELGRAISEFLEVKGVPKTVVSYNVFVGPDEGSKYIRLKYTRSTEGVAISLL